MFRANLGGKKPDIVPWQGQEKEYELLDQKEFLLSYVTYPVYPSDHWELSTIILVGSMGSGKSVQLNFIANTLQAVYGDDLQTIKTGDLVYAVKHCEVLKNVLMLVFDDAISGGFDSRRSMSSANIDNTQDFFLIRHLLEEHRECGIVFCVFAVQDYIAIDKRIRLNADLTIFKDYYPILEKLVPDRDCLSFLKDVTEMSKLKHDFTARSASLGITRTGNLIKFFTPQTTFEFTVVVPNPNAGLEKLISVVQKRFPDIMEADQLLMKGFLYYIVDKLEVHVNPAVFQKVIALAAYQQHAAIEEHERVEPTLRSKIFKKFGVDLEEYSEYILTSLFGLKPKQLVDVLELSDQGLYQRLNRQKKKVSRVKSSLNLNARHVKNQPGLKTKCQEEVTT